MGVEQTPESITVKQGGAGAEAWPTRNQQITRRFDEVVPKAATYTTASEHPHVTPAAGNALQPVWFYAQAAAALGQGVVLVTFRIGSRVLYRVELTGSQPWQHGAVVPPGAADEILTVELSANATVYINTEHREFTP